MGITLSDTETAVLARALDSLIENLYEFKDGDDFSEGEEMMGLEEGDTATIIAIAEKIR